MSGSDEHNPGSEANVSRALMPELKPQAVNGAPLLKRQLDLIRGVKVSASVLLGETELSVGKLFDMRAGEVLTLNRTINEPLDLLLDGHLVARGELVVVGDSLGLRITEVAER